MIVSHQHRFIFIKTNKTGSTSIEAAISQFCGPEDIITPFREDNEAFRQDRRPQNYRIEHPLKPQRPLWRKLLRRPERYYHHSVGYYEHMPAWRIRAYVGEEIWRSYFKFTFERNPWDRQVSWYFYKTKSKRRPPSFDRFMRDRPHAYVDNFQLYTIEGAVAVDFIGRFERLEEDLARALSTLKIPRKVTLPRTNVNRLRDSNRDYRKLYNDATREIVADWYAPEIDLLDYRF